jgi:cell division protein FtsB
MEESVGHLRARRNSLFTRTLLWGTGLVCVALLLATMAQAWSNSQLSAQMAQEQQHLEELQDQNAQLKHDQEYYKDPLVIEREAREKLGFARPGEQVVVVIQAPEPSQQQQRHNENAPYSGFWYAWLLLFFGE